MRRAIITAAIGALLLGACGGDDTDTASAGTSTTRDRTTTTDATTATTTTGPTSKVACQELYDLFQAGSDGEVYDIEWPGRLEEVQRVAEVDGDAWLYAELEGVIDGFDIRDAGPGVDAAGDVLSRCFTLIADDIAAES